MESCRPHCRTDDSGLFVKRGNEAKRRLVEAEFSREVLVVFDGKIQMVCRDCGGRLFLRNEATGLLEFGQRG